MVSKKERIKEIHISIFSVFSLQFIYYICIFFWGIYLSWTFFLFNIGEKWASFKKSLLNFDLDLSIFFFISWPNHLLSKKINFFNKFRSSLCFRLSHSPLFNTTAIRQGQIIHIAPPETVIVPFIYSTHLKHKC